MQDTHRKAKQIRAVIKYIKQFNNALIVVFIDDEVMSGAYLHSHIRDISLIHKAGLRIIIVPGARGHIDRTLQSANVKWSIKDDLRVTSLKAMPLVKMAAFDAANTIMTSLAACDDTAVIGNWVKARSIGVRDGFDFASAGEIEKLQTNAVNTVLSSGFIPIFPCIGWSDKGKPYNLSSIILAQKIAIQLGADKLFFLMSKTRICKDNFTVPPEIGTSQTGDIPALNLMELENFINVNPNMPHDILKVLALSKEAINNGVSRSHILDGTQDGVLPCEIFSDLGSGTMIYRGDYGKIRDMTVKDTSAVLSLMLPFMQSGKLLYRTNEDLLNQVSDYIVYELDYLIRGCAALHIYSAEQAEILGVAVDEAFSNIGIGPRLIKHLIAKAKEKKIKSVFILTTQAADWFEKLGFKETPIKSIPQQRLEQWQKSHRASKSYRMQC